MFTSRPDSSPALDAQGTGDSHVAHHRFAGDRTQSCGAWFSRHPGGGGREHAIEAAPDPGGAVAVATARADAASVLLRGAQLHHTAEPSGRRLKRHNPLAPTK